MHIIHEDRYRYIHSVYVPEHDAHLHDHDVSLNPVFTVSKC